MIARTLSGLAAVAIAVSIVGLTAAPASAATPTVLVSADGHTYSTTYPGQLFGTSAALVPGGSIDRQFWIKNNNTMPGYLRVALVGITTSDLDFAQQLSLTVSSAGWPGTAVPVLTAAPCYTLAVGQVIAGGGTLQMDALAHLGDLNGSDGQNGSVGYSIIVELSGVPFTEPDTTCPSTGLSVESTGTSPSASQSTYRFNSTTHTYTQGSTGTTTAVTPVITPPSTTNPTTGETPFQLDVNTARLYQEWDVALWILGTILGGIASAIISLRRRRTINPNTRTNGALR